jgi:hypothetical protein
MYTIDLKPRTAFWLPYMLATFASILGSVPFARALTKSGDMLSQLTAGSGQGAPPNDQHRITVLPILVVSLLTVVFMSEVPNNARTILGAPTTEVCGGELKEPSKQIMANTTNFDAWANAYTSADVTSGANAAYIAELKARYAQTCHPALATNNRETDLLLYVLAIVGGVLVCIDGISNKSDGGPARFYRIVGLALALVFGLVFHREDNYQQSSLPGLLMNGVFLLYGYLGFAWAFFNLDGSVEWNVKEAASHLKDRFTAINKPGGTNVDHLRSTELQQRASMLRGNLDLA